MYYIKVVVGMTSKKHGEIITDFIINPKYRNNRLVRLDSGKHPDLIMISPEGQITAVEIELSREGARETEINLEKYFDYDSVLIVTLKRKKPYSYVFKAKRYLPKEIYTRVEELSKGHVFGKHDITTSEIQKQLEIEFQKKIPLSTIGMIRCGKRKWTEIRNPPEFEVVEVRLKP